MRFREILICLWLLFGLAATQALAESLSVSPLDGGSSLRFGTVDSTFSVDKEVRIRISGYEGRQYQVYQRVSQTPINDRGEYLDRNVVLSKGLDGSNGAGTVYLNSYEDIRSSDQLIYTSSLNGLSDSFRMLYTVNASAVRNAGRYTGQLIFTVRPIGGGQTEEVVMNIYMDVSDNFDLTIGSIIGRDDVELSTNRLDGSDSIVVEYEGFRGQRLNVSQEFIEPPVNENGTLLDEEYLQFYVMSEEDGDSYFTDVTEISYAPVNLYRAEGAEDAVTIYYMINGELAKEIEAGTYRGRIRLNVETDQGIETRDIDVALESAPLFEMDIVYPEGGMGFSRILPSTPPQERAVIVKVKSNLGKPYSVMQTVNTPLQNEKGEEIDRKYFLVKQELLGNSEGAVKHPVYEPLENNNMTLFTSDRKGSPAEFQVIYQLRPYKTIKAGSYQTAIVYSLGEQ